MTQKPKASSAPPAGIPRADSDRELREKLAQTQAANFFKLHATTIVHKWVEKSRHRYATAERPEGWVKPDAGPFFTPSAREFVGKVIDLLDREIPKLGGFDGGGA